MSAIIMYLVLPVVVPLGDGKEEHTTLKLLPQSVVAYHPFGTLLSIYLNSGLLFYIAMTAEEYEAAVMLFYQKMAEQVQGVQKREDLKNSIKIVK